MNWEAALLFILVLIVCAELYAMRNTIHDLCNEVQELREKLNNKIHHDYNSEVKDD